MTYWSSEVTDSHVDLASLRGVTCYPTLLSKFIPLKILISISLLPHLQCRPTPNLQPGGLGKLYCLLIEHVAPAAQ